MQRHHFANKGWHLPTKAMVFPVVTYKCESWTIKKEDCQRINAFELWCWRRLLRVSWRARRSNQPILKEINPEYSLEGLMLNLQCFSHLLRTTDSLGKTLMLRKIEDRRKEGGREHNGWMASPIHWTWTWANSGRWWGTEKPGMLQSMGHKELDTTWWLNNNKLSLPDIWININIEFKRKYIK